MNFIKFILIIALCNSTLSTLAQDTLFPISIGANYSYNGSGDADGFLINLDYTKKLSKRFDLIYNLGFSVHAVRAFPGEQPNDPTIPDDLQTDVPLWVTNGVQLSSVLSYKFNQKTSSGLKIGIGPVIRLQINSSPNSYAYYQGDPWFNQPFYVIRETDRAFMNVGYHIRLMYDFKPIRRYYFGLNAFYQNDTNGDLLVGVGVRYTFLFK